MEKGGGKGQNQIECTPCCRCHRQEAYRHEEAQKTGSDYYNYLRSHAAIFNRSLLREKIEDDRLGLPPSEPMVEGGPNYVAAQQNKQEVYVPNEIYRDPLREAKHQ